MLNQWSINPKNIIEYYEKAGFPKLTKWQKYKIYIYCYFQDFKHWITRYDID